MPYPVNADHIAPQDGGFEPQRANNFAIEFYGIPGISDLTLSVATSPIPSTSNEPIEIPFRNEKRYVAGAAQVEDMAIAFRDYVDQQTHKALMTWRRLVYDPTTGRINRAALYKKRGAVFMFGPDGVTAIKSWQLIGCWPQNDPTVSLDSGSPDQVMLEVTIKVDKNIPDAMNYIA